MLLNIQDYIDRAEGFQPVTKKTVSVPGLGGDIEIVRQPLTAFMTLSELVSDAKTAQETLDANVMTIYEHCPILHDNRIQEAYGCKEPTDIVLKVFRENLSDMAVVLNAISGFYGSAEDDLKN